MNSDPFVRIGLDKGELSRVEPTAYDVRTMHDFNPLSGRYAKDTEPLRGMTSEFEWAKRRLALATEYLIGLSDEFQGYHGSRPKLFEKPFTEMERDALRKSYVEFSDADFARFKKIEGVTDHDVVALNLLAMYKLWEVIKPEVLERAMHMGRTSSDLDSNAFSLVMQDVIGGYYLPKMLELQRMFISKSDEWHKVPEGYRRPFTVIVAQTHEQPAVPTPIRKVVSNVVSAIDQGISHLLVRDPAGKLGRFRLYGKMGGAVGNDDAMIVAYPGHDWRSFYRRFIEAQGLEYQPTSDQDESNMRFLELRDILRRANQPLLKWCDDYSSYMSRGVLRKKTRKGESGSSIMPGKVNPWRTEGGEVALMLADAELGVFDYLVRQRKQGDLRRSYLKKAIALPMGNIGVGISRIWDDLKNTYPDHAAIDKEFDENPAIAAASMQMVLRAEGMPDAYRLMVEKTRGKHVTPRVMEETVRTLVGEGAISKAVGDEIRTVFDAHNNIGDALSIADSDLAAASERISCFENVYGIRNPPDKR